jgi:hypothetical protein
VHAQGLLNQGSEKLLAAYSQANALLGKGELDRSDAISGERIGAQLMGNFHWVAKNAGQPAQRRSRACRYLSRDAVVGQCLFEMLDRLRKQSFLLDCPR